MARGKRKKKLKDLKPNQDPKAPLDAGDLLSVAAPVLKSLKDDLLTRAESSPGVTLALKTRHKAEQEAKRTADSFEQWRQRLVGQVSAAWFLSCVFVRTLEDRELINHNRIAGPGAFDSQRLFFEQAPSLTEREYLLTVFRELSRLPAGAELFDTRHNPVWLLGPSQEGARALLNLFREPAAEQPYFRFGQPDTRFLGDLYQDLDEEVRKRYALLQTPHFIESFILDRTLERAIERFGLEETTLIDPTCGSGHFLLGAFERLCNHRLKQEPGTDIRQAALKALEAVAGADINPYAIAIARFRLTLAFLDQAGYKNLSDAPKLPLNLVVADSLLYNPQLEQLDFKDSAESSRNWMGEEFSMEDAQAARSILHKQYSAVVGNPPYITAKDKVLRDRYRQMYESASGKYSLSVPFAERLFQLAKKRGFVGQITANSFMKREFGKTLVESFLPKINLDIILNTSGAYLPGFGTPTVILLGTSEKPRGSTILSVLSKRGEPTTPINPEYGSVWQSISNHWNDIGYEDDFISTVLTTRKNISKHPWSLGGGGAAELKELLESHSFSKLGEFSDSIGISCVTGEDSVYLLSKSVVSRLKISRTKPLVTGEYIRDWSLDAANDCVFPYDASYSLLTHREATEELKYLWTYRSILNKRKRFGVPMLERGLTWYELQELYHEKFKSPLSIAFAFVATHNHFVLDRGGKVFKQSAPIIKLPPDATEEDHLALLAYLNSSTACFWMKQVFFDKGGGGIGGGLASSEWEKFYEFDGTKLSQLPIPPFVLNNATLTIISEKISQHADKANLLMNPDRFAEIIESCSDVRSLERILGDDVEERHNLLSKLVFLQEELDWWFYSKLELCPTQLALSDNQLADLEPEAFVRGSRPFELIYAQSNSPRREIERFFEFTGSKESEEVAIGSQKETRIRWQKRLDFLKNDSNTLVFEKPEFKRNLREIWRDDQPEKRAIYWLRCTLENILKDHETRAITHNELKQEMQNDEQARMVIEFVKSRTTNSTSKIIENILSDNEVPFLSSMRFSAKGMTKHQAWLATWEAQRLEDKGEKSNTNVPPKYVSSDYSRSTYWRLRGRLDVPKETFLSYPGLETDDNHSRLVGWAGWDHLLRAQVLSNLFKQRQQEGWDDKRLTPILAGLLELIPWVKQWHNEPDPNHQGARLGDFFEAFLDGECRELGLTYDDLRAWRPEKKKGRRKKNAGKKSGKAKAE